MSSLIILSLLLLIGAPDIWGQQGVYMSLNGTVISNNSYIDVGSIGEGDNALLCHTNKHDCCQSLGNRAGEWHFPNGSVVGTFGWNRDYLGLGDNYFYRNRGEGIVRLNRVGIPSEIGYFYCEIPDAGGVIQKLHVDIDVNITITPTGHNIGIAGENFFLKCSVDVTYIPHNLHDLSIQWLFGPEKISVPAGVRTSVTNSSNVYSSTLQFAPLQHFHTGMYTCQIGNNEKLAKISTISVISVISGDRSTPNPGQNYTLLCNISGVEYLKTTSTISYRWTKNNGTRTEVGTNSSTLHFSTLRLSDAGGYACEVTINSKVFTYIEYLDLKIPIPTSMVVSTSNTANPIRPIGTNITLMCTVELSATVNVPVVVNIQLIDPFGSPLTITNLSVSGSTYTSRSMVRSFGRGQSGVYSCTVTVSSRSPFLIDSDPHFETLRITTGVYMSLNGTVISNNSDIGVSNIGVGDNALLCHTDNHSCCQSPGNWAGEWHFPNGSVVETFGWNQYYHGDNYFYRNRGEGVVQLNRVGNPSESGYFRCRIPDARSVNQTLHVNIVSIMITGYGSTTAGEIYTLECSVNGASATFQWFEENGTQITTSASRHINSSLINSQLRFAPLHVSHRGSYTCQATILDAVESKSAHVSVNVPTVLAQISNETTPRPGHTFSLVCSISGAENLNATITYQWIKSNNTQTATPVGTNSNSLSIPSLRLSDIGRYTCNITVRSNYLLGLLVVKSRPHQLQIPIPQPTVHLVSDKPNPVLSGTSLPLTCSIELSSIVDVPLTITTLWTGPDGSIIAPAKHAAAVSLTHYTSRAVYSSVESLDSGNYTCTVTIGNEVRTSVKKSIVVGDGMFQLKLARMEDCQLWTHTKATAYKNDIEEALIEAVESRCKCLFPKDHLLKGSFSCDKSPHLITYRNTLITTHNFNATQLIGFIQSWVNSAPKIAFNWFSIRVDSTCPVGIASLDEPECGP